MNNKLSHNDFELLQRIKPMDAPPYLYTRIVQQIKNKTENSLKPTLVWTLSISMILLLLINIIVLKNETKSNSQSSNNIVSSMNMYTNNSLYQ